MSTDLWRGDHIRDRIRASDRCTCGRAWSEPCGHRAPERAPKPDGWHAYHICDGILREITVASSDAERAAVCVYCGQSATLIVVDERR